MSPCLREMEDGAAFGVWDQYFSHVLLGAEVRDSGLAGTMPFSLLLNQPCKLHVGSH